MGGGMVALTNLSAESGGATEARAFIGGGGSSTYDANYSAAFFVMMMPYAMMFANRKGPMRWLAIPMVPVLAVAMIRTGSRGGIIALAVLSISAVVFADKKQRKLQIGILVICVGAMLLSPHAELATRLQSLVSGSDYNFDARDGRWEVWSRGVGMMLRHPAFGVGIGAFQPADGAISGSYVDAHDAYVQIAAELGVLGITAFVIMIRKAFSTIWSRRRALRAGWLGSPASGEVSLDEALATAALCSLIAELTAATFLSVAYEAMTIFALTVPVALAMSQRTQAARVPSGPAAPSEASRRRAGIVRRQPASPPRIARAGS
jgi:O-antigen ligase